jgi:hypothetical protein
MSKKISTPGRLLTAADFTRIEAQTDNAYDYFDKNKTLHGYLYMSMSADVAVDNAAVLFVGPQNEITIQPIGTVTIVVKGSLDGTTFVAANTVTSADGFTRIQSKYKAIKVGTTGASGNPSVYMMVS